MINQRWIVGKILQTHKSKYKSNLRWGRLYKADTIIVWGTAKRKSQKERVPITTGGRRVKCRFGL